MELYTLTSRFLPKEIITDFTSVIWTERYAAAGDVQIVVPPTPSMIKRFAKGTFIGLRGTSEIMMIETQSIENGLLTVTGSSIVKFLNNRTAWFADTTYDGSDTTKSLIQSTYGGTDTAGSFISNIIRAMVINPVAFTSYWTSINLDWGNEIIHGLALGRVDTNGDSKALTFNKGPLYDGLAQFAEAEGLGFKLYLESANYSSGFVLRFATYRGRDKTSGQTINRMVRLTPKMDTLTNVKEINSIEKYINVVYVSYKNQISVHYPPDILSPPLDFNRRVLQVDAEDIFLEDDHILAYRNTVARNAFIDHVYIQAVDGQILPPISDYKFKRDYDLGDVIELEGYTGTISKARVTEYIRSQDQFGIKEFPTLAVIDPQHTGYMPDLEPSLDDGGGWPWDNDPSWDFPIDDSIDDSIDNDPEHDPDARKDPNDNPDPNPDPTPVFPTDGGGGNGDGGGGDGGSNPEPSSTYMVLGYYPDQNNGEAIAYLKFSGELLHAWTYAPEDTSPDANNYWLELLPLEWTFDHQYVVTRSEEDKESTDAYPWNRGFAFWLMSLDGTSPKRLTETLGDQERTTTDDPLGVTHSWHTPGIIWCGATDNWHWYVISDQYTPGEAVYADGTYWRRDLLPPDMSIHGEQQGTGTPQELFLASGTSTPSSTDDLIKILGVEDFPVHMRWSSWSNLLSSPDGSKLCMSRRQLGPVADWLISAVLGAVGGTFKLTMGAFGNLTATYTTAPIPFNATAAEVYAAIELACPLVQDPRLHGYPYVPYGGGPLPGGVNLRFDSLTPMGVWIVIHNDDLIVSFGSGYFVSHATFREIGPDRWFLCNYDGTSLEEIDFGTSINAFIGWSPDSTKLHALVSSEADHAYCRWLVYDVATGDISFPLDYSDSDDIDPNGYGPLTYPKFSPDSSKIVWMLTHFDNSKTLWISYADGTGAVEIYHDTVTSGHPTDLGIILLGGTRNISWSFDSKKIAIVDTRDEAPVWIFDTVSGSLTRIWDGSGWDNPDNQKWLYDPMTFDG